MFLEVNQLNKFYGSNQVLHDIHFGVEEGKLLCLLGPSGCGKTTILNAIGGFLTDYTGDIIIDGQNISSLPPESRPVSTVFQSYGLFPHLTVLNNVAYGLKFQGYSKEERIQKAEAMLEIVGLYNHRHKHIHQLSGGQQQRVALARSLVVEPKVLLLDEPLSNLDAKMRSNLRLEIKSIQQRLNITTILVTHDQQEAFEMADQIVLLNQGRIVQTGDPREIYDQPANDFVANFVGEMNKIDHHFIRPERLEITDQGVPMTIDQIIFQGETLKIYASNQTYQNVEITVLNQKMYQVGQKIYVQGFEELIEIKS
ncbi:ABC transporter ATP-binding protein [Falseniella ignava]|uniref:ABC-type quaternary amine transporter n=2 Tax=Falseniella ignava TaxID=137730 RepID=K1LGF7_9LACT|nr:ABC transporter ATP-binding protein [Falseniella ignava]EKB53701.1 hypothetical protein HMPREF9707_01454 [Falseniella ignava CCUG 37419]PKY88675.1 ABC transporter ATP-binding protein [Falseniella ignava]